MKKVEIIHVLELKYWINKDTMLEKIVKNLDAIAGRG